LFKAFFYDSKDDEAPLGEEERWIDAIPRCGDTVTLVFAASGEPSVRRPFTGEVVSVQWTFEPSDTAGDPDYCTVDITLRELRAGAPTPAEPSAAPARRARRAFQVHCSPRPPSR
jgi:hypothetical protein